MISGEQTMNDTGQNPETHIALFQRKEVRRTVHNNEWWFVITDVVAVLTDSANPQGYFRDMRRRDLPLAEALKGGGAICPPPWPRIRHGRRTPVASMLEHRRHFPPHPIHPQLQGRAVQTLAGQGGLRTHPGN